MTSEPPLHAENREETALCERAERFVAPRLEVVEEGVTLVERIDHAEVGSDVEVVSADACRETREKLDVEAQESIIGASRERGVLLSELVRKGGRFGGGDIQGASAPERDARVLADLRCIKRLSLPRSAPVLKPSRRR